VSLFEGFRGVDCALIAENARQKVAVPSRAKRALRTMYTWRSASCQTCKLATSPSMLACSAGASATVRCVVCLLVCLATNSWAQRCCRRRCVHVSDARCAVHCSSRGCLIFACGFQTSTCACTAPATRKSGRASRTLGADTWAGASSVLPAFFCASLAHLSSVLAGRSSTWITHQTRGKQCRAIRSAFTAESFPPNSQVVPHVCVVLPVLARSYVIYSTWSPYVQLCNVVGDFELHEQLDFQ
jgi:hypothetical protein